MALRRHASEACVEDGGTLAKTSLLTRIMHWHPVYLLAGLNFLFFSTMLGSGLARFLS